jgi:hypothetical protein
MFGLQQVLESGHEEMGAMEAKLRPHSTWELGHRQDEYEGKL